MDGAFNTKTLVQAGDKQTRGMVFTQQIGFSKACGIEICVRNVGTPGESNGKESSAVNSILLNKFS